MLGSLPRKHLVGEWGRGTYLAKTRCLKKRGTLPDHSTPIGGGAWGMARSLQPQPKAAKDLVLSLLLNPELQHLKAQTHGHKAGKAHPS